MPYEFRGLVLPFQQHHLLVYGPDAEALGPPLFGPPVFLRPAYRYFAKPEYLLPTEVVDDYGQRFTGRECYEWIEARADAFPRSDMIGVTSAGEPRTAIMKEMDLVEMAMFATPHPEPASAVRVDLALEARAVPDGLALAPAGLPLPLLARALPCFRLAPGTFGAVSAAIITHLLARRRWDWTLTFDQLDDLLADG